MRSPRWLGLLLLAAVLGGASLAVAAGPLDGIYLVTLDAAGVESLSSALIATQNGSQMVVILLDLLDSPLVFGVGQLTAQQQVTGSLRFSDDLGAGEFNVIFQGANVTGSATLFEVTFSLRGTKAF